MPVRAGAASVALLLLAGCGGDGASSAANVVEGNQAMATKRHGVSTDGA